MTGSERITRERKRQIEKEGWTVDHDVQHEDGSLCDAAIAYAIHGTSGVDGLEYWPRSWNTSWFKPGYETEDCDCCGQRYPAEMTIEQRIRNLEKAGALIAAEIDRLLSTV